MRQAGRKEGQRKQKDLERLVGAGSYMPVKSCELYPIDNVEPLRGFKPGVTRPEQHFKQITGADELSVDLTETKLEAEIRQETYNIKLIINKGTD